ncbi:MAG: hypothetical protein MJ077_10965, partial [Oscillospiraceae bacterium]|nr:hypothetical protein [Oscillospiraceae bacterium]
MTSSADRLAIESKSTNLSEHLTVEQPVSKRKRKRRRKRRKKPVPLSSPILTEENSSPKPLKLDDKPPPDPQQQTKRDTLKEDGDAVPIYHTSGRSLSRKLVSTTGSGKASDRLRSTSGGKPSDHLISTEKTTSGDLKT